MHATTTFSILLVALVSACQSSSQQDEISFERALSGQVGLSSEAKNAVVRSPEEWRALCSGSAPGIAAPVANIDWSKRMLIAVSLGSRPSGGYAVEIKRVYRQGSHWIVHARETRPGPDSMQTAMITAPFDCVATPRFEGRVVFTVE